MTDQELTIAHPATKVLAVLLGTSLLAVLLSILSSPGSHQVIIMIYAYYAAVFGFIVFNQPEMFENE